MSNHRSSSPARIAFVAVLLGGCGVIQFDPDWKGSGRRQTTADSASVRRGRGAGVCSMAIHRAMAAMPTASDTGMQYHAKLAEHSMAMHEYHVCLASDSASTNE